MPRITTLLIAAAVLVGGCTRADPAPDAGMTTEQFIDVIVALRQAAQESGDREEFDARRQQVLREAAVTDSMLLRFVSVRGRDVRGMAAVWDSVSQRLRSVTDGNDVLQ